MPQPRYVPIMPRHNSNTSTGGGSGGATPVLVAAPPPYTSANPMSHAQHPAHAAAVAAAAAHPYGANGFPHPPSNYHHLSPHAAAGGAANPSGTHGDLAASNFPERQYSQPPSLPSSLRDFPVTGSGARPGGLSGAAAAAIASARARPQPPSGYQSLDSGQFPASAVAWDSVSLADTESGSLSKRNGRRRRGRPGGLLGLVRHVMGFVGVSVLSGAAMALGAAAVNTGLDEQQAIQQARQRQGSGGRRDQLQRISYGGGNDLIPQRTLQQLRSPDLLALGRG
ncbi:hypothetical protein Vretifemale_15573 [Volvox reticuliferus]|nr:hypothetical protein Vretifemale_15573 [Volvox reticuliferus]